ncbi:MAG: hypothetical protein TUN42_04290 [Dehalogenimonas sp.]
MTDNPFGISNTATGLADNTNPLWKVLHDNPGVFKVVQNPDTKEYQLVPNNPAGPTMTAPAFRPPQAGSTIGGQVLPSNQFIKQVMPNNPGILDQITSAPNFNKLAPAVESLNKMWELPVLKQIGQGFDFLAQSTYTVFRRVFDGEYAKILDEEAALKATNGRTEDYGQLSNQERMKAYWYRFTGDLDTEREAYASAPFIAKIASNIPGMITGYGVGKGVISGIRAVPVPQTAAGARIVNMAKSAATTAVDLTLGGKTKPQNKVATELKNLGYSAKFIKEVNPEEASRIISKGVKAEGINRAPAIVRRTPFSAPKTAFERAVSAGFKLQSLKQAVKAPTTMLERLKKNRMVRFKGEVENTLNSATLGIRGMLGGVKDNFNKVFQLDRKGNIVNWGDHVKPKVEGSSKKFESVFEHTEQYTLSPEAEHIIQTMKQAIRLTSELGVVQEVGYPKYFLKNIILPRYKSGFLNDSFPVQYERGATGYASGTGAPSGRGRKYATLDEAEKANGEGFEQVYAFLNDPISAIDTYITNTTYRVQTQFAKQYLDELLVPLKDMKQGKNYLQLDGPLSGFAVKGDAKYDVDGVTKTIDAGEVKRSIEQAFDIRGIDNSPAGKIWTGFGNITGLLSSMSLSLDASFLLINVGLSSLCPSHGFAGLRAIPDAMNAYWQTVRHDRNWLSQAFVTGKNAEANVELLRYMTTELKMNVGEIDQLVLSGAATNVARQLGKGVGALAGDMVGGAEKAAGITDSIYGRFSRAFSNPILAYKMAMTRAARPALERMNDVERRIWGRQLDNITGTMALGARWGADRGTQDFLRNIVFLAPRFTASAFAMLGELAGGVGKLSKGSAKYLTTGGEEQLLAKEMLKEGAFQSRLLMTQLGSFAIGMGLLYMTVCEMTGQEPLLKPWPKEYGGDGSDAFSFKVGNTRVRFLGGAYQIFRGLGTIATSAMNGDADKTKDNLITFFKGRTPMGLRGAVEMAQNADYYGYAIRNENDPMLQQAEDMLGYTATKFLPLWGQTLVNDWVGLNKTPGVISMKFLSELVGGSSMLDTLKDTRDNLRNQYVNDYVNGITHDITEPLTTSQQQLLQEGGLTWDDLNSAQQNWIYRAHPDLQDAQTVYEEDNAKRNATGDPYDLSLQSLNKIADSAREQRYTDLDTITQQMLNGVITVDDWFKERTRVKSWYSGASWAIYTARDEMDSDTKAKYEKVISPEDNAMNQYWDLMNNPPQSSDGTIDWNARDEQVDKFLNTLSQDTRDYIYRNKDKWLLDAPPAVQQIEKAWQEDYEAIQEAGYFDLTTQQKDELRKKDPELDALLAFWGFTSTLKSPSAQNYLENKATELGRITDSVPALSKWSDTSYINQIIKDALKQKVNVSTANPGVRTNPFAP